MMMTVVMVMVVIVVMVMVVVMMVVVVMVVIMVMIVMVVMVMIMIELMSVKIFHVMIMVLMIQDHVKVAGVNAGFVFPCDLRPEALQRKAVQCRLQNLGVCAQIQQGCNRHIPADPGITFKIECLFF